MTQHQTKMSQEMTRTERLKRRFALFVVRLFVRLGLVEDKWDDE